MSEEFDYLIVGAGSAGCVLAEFLSRSEDERVLIIDSGTFAPSIWSKIPIGYAMMYSDPKCVRKFYTEPDVGLNGRCDYWPRGRVLGGSGSVNAMVYFPGLPSDFDDWALQGASGWSWADVRSAFESIRSVDGQSPGIVSINPSSQHHKVVQRFYDSARDLGFSYSEELGIAPSEAVGPYWITTNRGVRSSPVSGFLRHALKRKNVKLVKRASVERLLLRDGRVTGLEYIQDGLRKSVLTQGEIILCAGALSTPCILQRSGIGNGQDLKLVGVEPKVHLPAVGYRVQDHLAASFFFKASVPTLNQQLGSIWGKARAAAEYAFFRSGPLAISVNQAGGFVKTTERECFADVQIYFNPMTHSTVKYDERNIFVPDSFPGFVFSVNQCRPTSRGSIRIRGASHELDPIIESRYLSTDEDCRAAVRGVRLIERLCNAPALETVIVERKTDTRRMNDEAVLADFRDRAGSVYHPCGTCAIGSNAFDSVVDSRLKVHGFENLRIADASVFPSITSGNINAVAMMVGAKMAGFLIGDG